jgi:hypothetical protein
MFSTWTKPLLPKPLLDWAPFPEEAWWWPMTQLPTREGQGKSAVWSQCPAQSRLLSVSEVKRSKAFSSAVPDSWKKQCQAVSSTNNLVTTLPRQESAPCSRGFHFLTSQSSCDSCLLVVRETFWELGSEQCGHGLWTSGAYTQVVHMVRSGGSHGEAQQTCSLGSLFLFFLLLHTWKVGALPLESYHQSLLIWLF